MRKLLTLLLTLALCLSLTVPALAAFTDVPDNAYYADAVAWAVENDVTTGVTAATFAPERTCTRAEIIAFLWRAAGKQAPAKGANPYSDVPAGQFYTDAVLWAAEKGITEAGSTFSPNAPCTRTMAVTFLWKNAGSPAIQTDKAFTDVPQSASYAPAVAWAVERGVTTGTTTTTFSPQDTCTRAQIVTFLYRAICGPETVTNEIITNLLTIGDMPLYEVYRDDGTVKPIVIVIHGGGGSKEETLPWAMSLADQGFYALAIDAAAHGDNKSGPLDAVRSWAVTVTQLDAVLDYYTEVDQADTDHFGMVGSSFGGTVCFAYTAHGKYTPTVIAPSVGTPDYTLMSDSPLYDRYGDGEPSEPFMSREEVREFAAEYSPVNYPERFLNTYIYSETGMEDNTASPEGVKKLENALRNLGGTKFVFKYYEGVGHEGSPDYDPNLALRQILLGDMSDPVFE